uniref:Candidate secreted effector n=1 Tax=Meloidogyne incognita TaxID=6306 RepID=A0A914MRG9_MELIC
MVLKCLCILCILAWIFLIIVRFEDKRGRQCESVILKLLNSTKCLERNIIENNNHIG